MKRYVICDIDGVLADCTHRLHYASEGDYDKFYSGEEMADDEPIDGGWELLRILMDADAHLNEYCELILMTGRPERTLKITNMWLNYQNTQGFYFPSINQIYMRKDGDHRKSAIVKQELMQKFMVDNSPERGDTIIFIDDDPSNCYAIVEHFPEVITLTYGIGRMNGTGDRK